MLRVAARAGALVPGLSMTVWVSLARPVPPAQMCVAQPRSIVSPAPTAVTTFAAVLKACLNGRHGRGSHPALPVTPAAAAVDAAACVRAGAVDIHVHPKDANGTDTLDADVVASFLTAIRAHCPRVSVGITTGAWARSSRGERQLFRHWSDHVSVNMHESGAVEVARAALREGIAVDAGLWTSTEGPTILVHSGLATECRFLLIEATEPEPSTAVRAPTELADRVAELGL